MNARLITIILILFDWLASASAQAVFYFFRKIKIEGVPFSINDAFYYGILIIPFIWLFIYLFQGTYHDVRRLHRIKIFNLTFIGNLIGVLVIFFVFLIDDEIIQYTAKTSTTFTGITRGSLSTTASRSCYHQYSRESMDLTLLPLLKGILNSLQNEAIEALFTCGECFMDQ